MHVQLQSLLFARPGWLRVEQENNPPLFELLVQCSVARLGNSLGRLRRWGHTDLARARLQSLKHSNRVQTPGFISASTYWVAFRKSL